MTAIEVYFTFYSADEGGNPILTNRTDDYSFDANTTYEEIIHQLIQKQFLLPLSDPHLRYKMILQPMVRVGAAKNQAYPKGIRGIVADVGNPVSLKEGQTLASIRLMPHSFLRGDISIETKPSPNKEAKQPPSLGETISAVAQTATNVLIVTASVATIIQTLIVVQERWEKTHHIPNKASSQQHISRRQIIPWLYSQIGGMRSASPPKSAPNSKGTDILSIRLRMSHGTDHEFEEWLTDPDRLKHYIDVFNQPSSSIQPLQAIFVQRNGKEYKVDVSKGAQDNLQLNELLSYLNIDSAEK